MENINNQAAQNSFFNFISTSVVGNIRRAIPSIGSFFAAAGDRMPEISSSVMMARAAVSSVYSKLVAFGGSVLNFLQSSGLRESIGMAQRSAANAATTVITPIYNRLMAFGGSALKFLQNFIFLECIQMLPPLISLQTFAIIGLVCAVSLIFSKKARKCAFLAVKFLVHFTIKLPLKLAARVLFLPVSWAKKIANIALLASLAGFVVLLAIGSLHGRNVQSPDQITGDFAMYATATGLLAVGLNLMSRALNFVKSM
jgi:hypothetical protein